MKYWKGVLTAATLGFGLASTSAAAETGQDESWNLMLTGSDLNICSSMNSDACSSTDWIEANDMRTARLFQLTDVRRREALRGAIWPDDREDIREELDEALRDMVDYFARGVVPEHRLVNRFRSRAYIDLLGDMTDAEFNKVLDNLEMPRLEGLEEHVNLAETKDHSAKFVQTFASMAERLNTADDYPARILLVTAGARDSFAPVDRHVKAFEAAGVEVAWLPIDAAVVKARQEERCDDLERVRREVSGVYDRNRVNPERHERQQAFCKDDDAWQDMLAASHGVFFVGDNPDQLRQAFFNEDGATPVQQQLLSRFNEGSLVVGAAGRASQAMVSSNMLTNGTSRYALREGSHARRAPAVDCDRDDSCPRGIEPDSLTYEPRGGLGFFRSGIVDTEFSQRGYHGRLLRLAADTGTRMGVGIDRDTALLVNTRDERIGVQGAEGVFLAEDTQGGPALVATTFHYLRQGTLADLSGYRVGNVEFAEQESRRAESSTTRFLSDTGVFDHLDSLCGGREEVELLEEHYRLIMRPVEESRFADTRGRCQVYNATLGIAIEEQ